MVVFRSIQGGKETGQKKEKIGRPLPKNWRHVAPGPRSLVHKMLSTILFKEGNLFFDRFQQCIYAFSFALGYLGAICALFCSIITLIYQKFYEESEF